MPLTMPKAVLFDNDGVLVASEPLHWAAWGNLLKEMGIPYEEAEVAAQVGKTAPQILTAILDHHRPEWSKPENRGAYVLEDLALRKNDFYLKLLKSQLRAYPGVEDGLKVLRSRGVKIAVVSNAKRRELDGALQATGLEGLVDLKISRDDSKIPKPDPTPYLMAAASLGVEPVDCLVVEDSPPGIESGLMARIPSVAITTNFSREAMAQPVPGRPDLKPVAIFSSMEEFFETLLMGC